MNGLTWTLALIATAVASISDDRGLGGATKEPANLVLSTNPVQKIYLAGNNPRAMAVWLGKSNNVPVIRSVIKAKPGLAQSEPQLKPGLYETFPSTSLVLVPGPHPDDKCIIGQSGATGPMPIIRPDLHFVPRDKVATAPPLPVKPAPQESESQHRKD